MGKSRVVFLFGAGAVLPWGGPSTGDLTTLVRESGFHIIDNKTTITEYIYQCLIANNYAEGDINFETIINVIEELIVYYSNFSRDKHLPSLLKCFLSSPFEKEIFNFKVEGGEPKHGYKLQVPIWGDYNYSDRAVHNETPEQFFLLHLLNDLLSTIIGQVSKYAWHTRTHTKIDFESSNSQAFMKWAKSFIFGNTLRLYTLNYDRVFKVLLEKAGIHLFEGFDCDESPENGEYLRADIPMILNNEDIHTHYNLHGSANWDVGPLDHLHLPNPEIYMRAGMNLPINNKMASFQMERGKTLLVTNIITGYQKAQKTLISPFRQMHSSFDKDCLNAAEILIIGYSFGDEHINQSIKGALRYNPNIKITIVDPGFIKNKKDELLALEILPYRNDYPLYATTLEKDKHSFFNGAVIVYTLRFQDYLAKMTGS